MPGVLQRLQGSVCVRVCACVRVCLCVCAHVSVYSAFILVGVMTDRMVPLDVGCSTHFLSQSAMSLAVAP